MEKQEEGKKEMMFCGKRLPRHYASRFLLLSYALLSAVPFVPALFGQSVERPWQMLFTDVLVWTLVWGVLKRPARFHWLLLPAFLATPIEIYLLVYYGQGITTQHLGIITETSPREAVEFLGSKLWLMLALLLSMLVWWVLGLLAARRTQALEWQGRSRRVGLVSLGLLAYLSLYAAEFGVNPQFAPARTAIARASAPLPAVVDVSAGAAAAEIIPMTAAFSVDPAVTGLVPANLTNLQWPSLPYWVGSAVSVSAFSSSWPFGLVGRGGEFYEERQYLAELGKANSAFRFHARQAGSGNTPQVVVMVIGESSRYDRWSLNGYQRETNPLLKQEANLVVLTDMITPVSATRLSVPVIISRKRATQSLDEGFAEKSFLSAYKEAGFKTFWLSNQMSLGRFDTPVSVFASEADVVQFLNLGSYRDGSNFDQILLDPLKQALADTAPKKLIVLHTLGSHWNYSLRHPQTFDRWQPSLLGMEKPDYTDASLKQQMNNSYDNTILYTDWFLSHVIGTLKQSGGLSSLIYVADHGETLYDGTCKMSLHGHNTQFDFHVPALAWYSDTYQQHYPDKVKQLLRHREAHLATENIFHTLLDMADVRYPGDQVDWSFLSDTFEPHRRNVNSNGWVNYDKASFEGECREVRPKFLLARKQTAP